MTIIVRGQRWVLAAGHPSKDVREHAIDAAQTLGDRLGASSGLVQSMPETLDEDAVTQARAGRAMASDSC